MSRDRIVCANWKMSGSAAGTQAYAARLTTAASTLPQGVQVVVFPPSIYLQMLAAGLSTSPVECGVQNIYPQTDGAFTGETAASMVRDAGGRWCLVGHSERRALFGETDAFVAEKTEFALANGLKPVVCVGETLDQRDSGRAEDTVGEQLSAVVEAVGIERLAGAVIAYEPVWAIGTGRTATPEVAQAMHEALRGMLARWNPTVAESMPILYGGSVKPDNAAALFACPDIDGGLIGGASLAAESFLEIVAAAGV